MQSLANSDALLASLTDRLSLGAILGNVGRVVVVLAPAQMIALGITASNGQTEAQKVVLVRGTVNQFTVAHEIAHTMPYLWSSDQMRAQCGVDYHNKPIQIAHGFRVTDAGVEHRAKRDPRPSFMGPFSTRWADQCTYWNLVNQLQNPPDPAVPSSGAGSGSTAAR